jgi:hypothetical protein
VEEEEEEKKNDEETKTEEGKNLLENGSWGPRTEDVKS